MAIKEAPGVTGKTTELADAIRQESSGLFDLGSGCLAYQTKQPKEIVLFYDPSRIVVEFFIGAGSTTYFSDPEHVHRMVVDSAGSKAEYKRSHRSPHYSRRYAREWHGQLELMEVPFPLYMDPMCVVAFIQNNGLYLPHDGSAVPQLAKTSNIADIIFVSTTLIPSTDEDLRAFLSDRVPGDRLAEFVDRMSNAYALRQGRGPEKPYRGTFVSSLLK